MFRKLVNFISEKKEVERKGAYAIDFSPDFSYVKNIFSAINQRLSYLTFGKRMALYASLFLLVTTPLGFVNDFFTILTLHGMAAISRFHYRFLKFSIGVELSVFMIALTGLSHGPIVAMVVGAIHFLVSILVTKEGYRSGTILPCLIGYMAVGLAAGLVPMTNILVFGMILTAVYNVITIPIFLYVLRFSVFSQLFFIATHFAFNYYVFSNFGEAGLRLIGL